MDTISATRIFPIIPIRDAVIFPGRSLPLRVGRPVSVHALEKAMSESPNWVLIVTQKSNTEQEPKEDNLFRVGTLCKIEKTTGNAKNGYQIVVHGHHRFKISEMNTSSEMLQARGEVLKDIKDADEATLRALTNGIKTLAREILELIASDTSQLLELIEAIDDLSLLIHLSAENLDISTAEKQSILETLSIRDRALKILELMQAQKNSLALQNEIRGKLSKKLGKHQREIILREQLKAIQEELGDTQSEEKTQSDYRKKIEDAQMPEAAKKAALDELKKLESMGNNNAESHVIRNYLDLLCALPWSVRSESDINLEKAREILDHDHYGLNQVKKRILQHLAVMKLKKNMRGSILLLVGPPGVGKTSLGQSIAKTLNRKFVRASLGGIRDDAEIRGHRRTYVGAMPGRIIQSIKRAGENNPVMLLDEIDKMGRGFSGDPASAMLEVLDPEQNSTFVDHYLDLPFDLSNVFFIATANSLENIPGPLLDRMEVIELTGYTVPEKLHIAKNHLIPKQLEEHGLLAAQVSLEDEALLRTITHYTRESGVRDLQRKIAQIFRASADRVLGAQPEALPIIVRATDLEDILGAERFIHEVTESIAPPGVVTGLAWTPVGGEILLIETRSMPGKGQLMITGQLGEVMRESAQIALSLVRSNISALAPQFDYDKKDIHIHVPSGAIPKDGPSAGVTLLTSLASLVLGKSVYPKLAMSGEITLRGAVLPVGGIKEKVIAAHRAGVEKIILSKRNQKDLKEIPEEIRNEVQFFWVDTASEVLKIALGIEPEQIPELLGKASLPTVLSGPAPIV